MKKVKHYLYRATVARYIDTLFYEAGDSRRNHTYIYRSIVRYLRGINENSFYNYRHDSDTKFTKYQLPAELRSLLQLYVVLHKILPSTERARYLQHPVYNELQVIKSIKQNSLHFTADMLISHISNIRNVSEQ